MKVVGAGGRAQILLDPADDAAVVVDRLHGLVKVGLSSGGQALSSLDTALHLVLVAPLLVALTGSGEATRGLPAARLRQLRVVTSTGLADLVLSASMRQFLQVHFGHDRELEARVSLINRLLQGGHIQVVDAGLWLLWPVGPLRSRWLLDAALELALKPVDQLQRQLTVVHQLNLHELLDALQAELFDDFLQEVLRVLARWNLLVKDRDCEIEDDLTEVAD